MRTAWREATSALSRVSLRVISRVRVSCSAAMRSAASNCSRAICAASTACCGGDLGLLDGAGAGDFQRAGALLGRDALGVDRRHLHDAQLFGGLAGRDLGFLDRPRPLDLAPAGLLFIDDARFGDRALLQDAGFFDRFAGLDLGLLDGAGALDLLLAHLAFGGDPGGVDRALVGDPRLLDGLAGGDLDFLDGAGALDFLVADVAFGGDAGLVDRLLVGDARLLDRFPGGDLRLLGLGLAQRALPRHFGALHGAPHLDVALLFEPRGLAVALDVERLALGFEVAGADPDHRILLDVVAQLAAVLDVLHQLGQAFGVEAVRRIEVFEVGLVEVGDRDGFQFEAVLRQRLGGGGLDPRDIFAALLVHLLHGHFGGDRAQRGDELAGQQGVQALGLEGAAAERRRGDRHRLARRLHPDVEIGLDVDAHAVAR